MIHFFPMFSKGAGGTELNRALQQTGVTYRIFADYVSMKYRSRMELLFRCLPHLALVAFRNACKSLIVSRPLPGAVVLGSDIEIIIFAAVRAVTRRKTKLVLGSFIYTSRSNPKVEIWRRRYYRFVLSLTDLAVVHSRFEIQRSLRLFPGLSVQFVFVPYGSNIEERARFMREAEEARQPGNGLVLVTAGKSGRDYPTLFAAMEGVKAELRVICDLPEMVPQIPKGAEIVVLDHCHGDDYLAQLARADIVVIPLAVAEVSAGQMVLIQAQALGRPVIATDTPTLRDYVEPDVDAILVPRADTKAMREAIVSLLSDVDRRAELSRNASLSFDRTAGTLGLMGRLVQEVQSII